LEKLLFRLMALYFQLLPLCGLFSTMSRFRVTCVMNRSLSGGPRELAASFLKRRRCWRPSSIRSCS